MQYLVNYTIVEARWGGNSLRISIGVGRKVLLIKFLECETDATWIGNCWWEWVVGMLCVGPSSWWLSNPDDYHASAISNVRYIYLALVCFCTDSTLPPSMYGIIEYNWQHCITPNLVPYVEISSLMTDEGSSATAFFSTCGKCFMLLHPSGTNRVYRNYALIVKGQCH